MEAQESALSARLTTSRNRSQWSNPEEYIIGITQHPSMIESQKERFAPIAREIGNLGSAIEPESDV